MEEGVATVVATGTVEAVAKSKRRIKYVCDRTETASFSV